MIQLNSVSFQKNVGAYYLSALGTYTVGYYTFNQSGEYTVYIYAQNKGKENHLVYSQNVTIYEEAPTSTIKNDSTGSFSITSPVEESYIDFSKVLLVKWSKVLLNVRRLP